MMRAPESGPGANQRRPPALARQGASYPRFGPPSCGAHGLPHTPALEIPQILPRRGDPRDGRVTATGTEAARRWGPAGRATPSPAFRVADGRGRALHARL